MIGYWSTSESPVSISRLVNLKNNSGEKETQGKEKLWLYITIVKLIYSRHKWIES